jgi:hypothetical protein
MVASLGLAALGAVGVAELQRRVHGRAALVAGALILLEAFAVPIPIDQNSIDYADKTLAPLPSSVDLGPSLPPAYRAVARLPADAVLLELPLGEPAFDVRYMFYSTTHWRRLVNGYSGGAPPEYLLLTEALKDRASRPARAWQAVVGSTATHVLVHEALYKNDLGPAVTTWLRANGAAEIAAFGSDRLFTMPSR